MLGMMQLGDSNLKVSRMCYGAAHFGTVARGEKLESLYNIYREAGGNFFDTAHCYAFWQPNGLGISERAIGELVRQHGDEKNVVIASKGGHNSGGDDYPRPDKYLSPAVIQKDLNESLDRLKATSIDLYYLHRDDERMGAGEIIDMMQEHLKAGTIGHLAASNWKASRIDAANEYAAKNGKVGFVASQPMYSLALADEKKCQSMALHAFTQEDFAWHEESKLPVCAYSSTATGYFATNGKAGAAMYDNPISQARLARTNNLARELSITPNQLCLAWLLNHPFPVIPILGTTDASHLKEALAAIDIKLSPEQFKFLRDGNA